MRTIFDPVLTDSYETVYVDLDGAGRAEAIRAARLFRTPLYGGRKARVEMRRTTRGYHLACYSSQSISGDFVLDYLLASGADPLFVRRFLKTGTQTLFSVRRGEDRGELEPLEDDYEINEDEIRFRWGDRWYGASP